MFKDQVLVEEMKTSLDFWIIKSDGLILKVYPNDQGIINTAEYSSTSPTIITHFMITGWTDIHYRDVYEGNVPGIRTILLESEDHLVRRILTQFLAPHE